MLKTNSKEVKNYFINFVSNNFEEDEIDEAIDNYNNYCYNAEVLGFSEFLTNYECVLPIYYCEQRTILKEALQETDEEANKYDNEQVQKLFFVLCDRAFKNVFNVNISYRSNRGRFYGIATRE